MFECQGQHTGYVASFPFGIHCFSDSPGSVLGKEAFVWSTGAGGERFYCLQRRINLLGMKYIFLLLVQPEY